MVRVLSLKGDLIRGGGGVRITKRRKVGGKGAKGSKMRAQGENMSQGPTRGGLKRHFKERRGILSGLDRGTIKKVPNDES